VLWNGNIWVGSLGTAFNAPGVSLTTFIFYSYDGINWTASSSAASLLNFACNDFTWNGNVWIAGGQSSLNPQPVLIYSYDGINWINTNVVSAGIIGNGAAVGVGSNGFISIACVNTTGQAYSYDGITWIMNASAPSAYIVRFVWNGLMWLGLGGTTNYQVIYSYDGFAWTASSSAASLIGSGNYAYDAAWNGTRWVIVSNSSNRIIYSSDGISWTASSSGNSLISFGQKVSWNGIRFVASGGGSNAFITSTDGITWAALTSANTAVNNASAWCIGSRTLPVLTYRNRQITSKFCVGGQGSTLSYSYDGLQWYRSPSSVMVGYINCIVWNGVMWVAVSRNGDASGLAYSYDGITWTIASSATALLNTYIQNVAWGGNIWVAVGQGTSSSTIYSYNGLNWTNSTSAYNLSSTMTCVAWNGSMWLIGTAAFTIIYSTDGITWGLAVANTTLMVSAIASNGSMWVWGSNGTGATVVSYSFDGFNWTSSSSAASLLSANTFEVNNILWSGTRWVLTSYSLANPIIYSNDGINWTAATSFFSGYNYVRGLAWNGSTWIAGGIDNNVGVAVSTDGIQWARNTLVDSSFFVQGVASIVFGSRNVLPIQPVRPGVISYIPATSGNWASPVPRTLTAAIDRIAAAVSTLRTSAIP